MGLSSVNRVDPSCECGRFFIVAWTAVFTRKVQNKDEAIRSSFLLMMVRRKLSVFCISRVGKIILEKTKVVNSLLIGWEHDGSTRFTENNSTYSAGKCLPLHNLKLSSVNLVFTII